MHVDRRAVERVRRRDERLDALAPIDGDVARARAARARRRRGRARPRARRARRAAAPAEARRPSAAGAGEAHAAEEAARRGVGRVEVAVGVEPEHLRVGAVARRRRAAWSARSSSRRARSTGKLAAGERVVDLAAGLEQAAARVAQVVVVARRARLARRSRSCAPRRRGARRAAAPAPPRRARRAGVRSDVRQRRPTTDAALSGPSTPARASRRTPVTPSLDVLGREARA